MVQKSKGPRKRTRYLLRTRGKTPITRYLQEFEIGSKVLIRPVPSSHKGMPFRRFIGRVGVVVEKIGKSYIVRIKDGKKEKSVISRPEHLKAV